ncbi:MAG: DeoR/GlpR family DNA-binding transcription regulator [Spirochaetia bacterium]|nr:DeoR/GlpR family DNA-binding transcription regulator [Spirochaetia bacterium]
MRVKKIKEILLEYKHIDINTLSSLLSVSMATIRRDLDKLEQESFLVRAHGGAFLNDPAVDEVQLSGSEDPYAQQKREIGILASALIDDNDIIFIGGGVTCLQIAKHVKNKKHVTIITNNVNILTELASNTEISLKAVGGDLEVVDQCLTMAGDISLETLSHMYFNKSFVTVDAIDLDNGYFTNSPQQGKIIRLLQKNSDDLLIVADYTKFGKRAFSYVGELLMTRKIVTNIDLSESYKKQLFESGFQLYMTFDNQ